MQRTNIIRNYSKQGRGSLLTFTATQANSSVKMFTVGLPPTISLEYTTNGIFWNPYTFTDVEEEGVVVSRDGQIILLPNIGDKVSFRAVTRNSSFCDFGGKDSSYYDPIAYYRWSFTGEIEGSGLMYYLVWRNARAASGTSTLPRGAFFSMFKDCTQLVTAPYIGGNVKRIKVTDRCFAYMFQGCTSLVSCYWDEEFVLDTEHDSFYAMFDGCSSLVETSDILTYGNNYLCNITFKYMFRNCTSYTHPIKIRMHESITFRYTNEAYYGTFYGCSSIIDLSGVVVYSAKQPYMCKNCSSLKVPPTPYTESIWGTGAFDGCSSLDYIYMDRIDQTYDDNRNQLYQNCTNLKEVIFNKAFFRGIRYNSGTGTEYSYTKFKPLLDIYKAGGTGKWYGESRLRTLEWVKDVAANGNFYVQKGFQELSKTVHTVPSGWNINEIDDRPLTFEAETANCRIRLRKQGEIQDEPFYYSLDGGTTWQRVTFDEYYTLTNVGDTICFTNMRREPTFKRIHIAGNVGYYRFECSSSQSRVKCYGNVYTMLRRFGVFMGVDSPGSDDYYMLYGLFGLMRGSVTTLPTIPDYPFTLPAQAFGLWFMSDNTDLTQVVLKFKRSKIQWNCFYRTFENSQHLQTVILKIRNDRFLSNANGAFLQTFSKCTALTKIGVYFNTWGNDSNIRTLHWLQDASSNGTFICPKGLNTSLRDDSHIPVGWTVKRWYEYIAEQYPKDPNEDPDNPTTVAGLMEKYPALEDVIDTYPDVAPILDQYPGLVHSLVNTGYTPYMIAHGDIWETDCMMNINTSVSFTFEKVNANDCVGIGVMNSATQWEMVNCVCFIDVTDPTPSSDEYTNATYTRYYYMGYSDNPTLRYSQYTAGNIPAGKHTVTLGNTGMHYTDITLDGVSNPTGARVKGTYTTSHLPYNLYINGARRNVGWGISIQQMWDKFFQSDAKYYNIIVYDGETLKSKFVPIADGVFANIADLDNIKIYVSEFSHSDIFGSGVESRSSVFGLETIQNNA